MIRVGIIGGGWPGAAHAKGYAAAGGFKIVAVADLVPERRAKLMGEYQIAREYPDAKDLLADVGIDAVSVCLPNHLHTPVALAALRAGKHVLCETPPSLGATEARRLDKASKKAGKVLLYAAQRRFGAAETAARQTIMKSYIGDAYHVRAVWTRTRGIPIGTGWFTQKALAGGGAMTDLGFHMLDLAWFMLGQPKPVSVFGVTQQRFADQAPAGIAYDVEDAAFAMVRFEGGKSLELATSWAINQPPQQNGTICRIYGSAGAIELYTPQGAILYRGFAPKAEPKATPLTGPKVFGHVAMARHFRDCIGGKCVPSIGGEQGIALMEMIEGIYKSSETGKSVSLG